MKRTFRRFCGDILRATLPISVVRKIRNFVYGDVDEKSGWKTPRQEWLQKKYRSVLWKLSKRALGRRCLPQRKRIAVFTPLPPEETGIAIYSDILFSAEPAKYDLISDIRYLKPYKELLKKRMRKPRNIIHFSYYESEMNSSNRYLGKIFVVGNSPHHDSSVRTALATNGEPGRFLYFHEALINGAFLPELERRGIGLRDYVRKWYPEVGDGIAEMDRPGFEWHSFCHKYGIWGVRPLIQLSGITDCIVNTPLARKIILQDVPAHLRDKIRFCELFLPVEKMAVSEPMHFDLPPGTSLVGTFGMVTPMKGIYEILNACKLLNDRNFPVRLLLGGYNADSFYATLPDEMKSFCLCPDTKKDDDFLRMMKSVDTAVQLRLAPHGESSGCIAQLLGLQVPLVTNKGFIAEDQEKFCTMTGAAPSTEELAAAIERSITEKKAASAEDLKRYSASAASAKLYDFVKQTAGTAAPCCSCAPAPGKPVSCNNPVFKMKKTQAFVCNTIDWALKKRHVSKHQREIFISALKMVIKQSLQGNSSSAAKKPPAAPAAPAKNACKRSSVHGRILVDLSAIINCNRKTGIERVVIRLLDVMMNGEDTCFTPVALDGDAEIHYVHYNREDCSFQIGKIVDVMDNDILIMLDASWDKYHYFLRFFDDIRDHGGKIFVVVYDLIPVHYPNYFLEDMGPKFRHWLDTAIREADGLLCISRSVAAQLRDYIIAGLPARRFDHALKLGHFVLGADFVEAPADTSAQLAEIFARCKGKTKFLSVSTVEPRKNHALMLDVMERLWADGFDVCYFIVGKEGWNISDLSRRILSHPELDHRLFWFQSADDSMLQAIYKESDILLNLSIAEGYGLSLVEGAHYHCSVVASDIPVFREIIADETTLFCDISSLDATVSQIEDRLRKAAFVPSTARTYQWSDSLKNIMDVILEGQWDEDLSDFTSALDSIK